MRQEKKMKRKNRIILEAFGLFVFMTACGRSPEEHAKAVSVQAEGEEKIFDKEVLSEKEDGTAETEDDVVETVGKGAITEVPTIYESVWNRVYDHLVGADFIGDLGELFEELQDIDIDGDGLTDVVWFSVDTESGTPSSAVEVRFGNGDSVEIGEMQSAPNLDLIVTFRDIDADGVNEILAVSYIESTAEPIAVDVVLLRLEDKEWVLYPLWDSDNDVTYMCDEENLINDFIGDGYPKLRDAELTENGVALLYDLGMKDGSMLYLDYFGVEGVLTENEVEVVDAGKEIAEKYWPVDMEISKDAAMPE